MNEIQLSQQRRRQESLRNREFIPSLRLYLVSEFEITGVVLRKRTLLHSEHQSTSSEIVKIVKSKSVGQFVNVAPNFEAISFL